MTISDGTSWSVSGNLVVFCLLPLRELTPFLNIFIHFSIDLFLSLHSDPMRLNIRVCVRKSISLRSLAPFIVFKIVGDHLIDGIPGVVAG